MEHFPNQQMCKIYSDLKHEYSEFLRTLKLYFQELEREHKWKQAAKNFIQKIGKAQG